MGQEVAALFPATVVVVASWEPAAVKKKPAAEDSDMLPEKAKAPARGPSVPPPPGRRPSSVPGGTRSSFSRARAVRPEDDPFLAAYLACTRSGGGSGKRNGGGMASRTTEPKACRKRFTWAGLGMISCKGSGAAVEHSMVKLSKRPEPDPRGDA